MGSCSNSVGLKEVLEKAAVIQRWGIGTPFVVQDTKRISLNPDHHILLARREVGIASGSLAELDDHLSANLSEQEQEAAWQRAIERNPMTCIELQKRWLVHRQAFRDCRLNTVDPQDCKGSTEKYRDSLAALRIECQVFLRSPPLPWETAGHGLKAEENFKRPD